MKRTAVGFVGLLYGLVLTWLCLYVLSHMHWPLSTTPATGCHEMGKCPIQWWEPMLLFVDVLGVPILFAGLNVVAWKRWPLAKWALAFTSLTFLTIAYRICGFVCAI